MQNYHQKKKQCWNGMYCFYLKNNKCHFFHPAEHYWSCGLVPPPESLQLDINASSFISENCDTSSKSYSYVHQEEEKIEKQPRIFIYQDKQIPIVQIQTLIQNEGKAWFFKQNRHFHQFEGSKYDICSICLQDYKTQTLITLLYCNHAFHKQCIQIWLKQNIQCPLCKKDFKNHDNYKQFPLYHLYLQKIMNQQSMYSSSFYSEDDDSYYLDEDYEYSYQNNHYLMGLENESVSVDNQANISVSLDQQHSLESVSVGQINAQQNFDLSWQNNYEHNNSAYDSWCEEDNDARSVSQEDFYEEQ